MVTIQDMDFGYNGATVFGGLSLQMSKGNIYGLLGLNGAGKTTLMKLICGLLFPQTGTIRTFGENPAKRYPDVLSRIFMLPEELSLPGITEKEYVMSRSPFFESFDNERFERYLRDFDLPRNKRLTKLSYGQKKKFLLSFGLACGSELLVLDEPTNGLDIPSKGMFRRLVAEALTEDRVFVISTHQVRDVDSLIDPVIILHDGKVLFEHGMDEVSKRLHMKRTVSPPPVDSEGLIYSEAAVGGYWSVWSGGGEDDGPIDLEILFNTVISRPDIYSRLFDRQGEIS